jgi:hypothetical protein
MNEDTVKVKIEDCNTTSSVTASKLKTTIKGLTNEPKKAMLSSKKNLLSNQLADRESFDFSDSPLLNPARNLSKKLENVLRRPVVNDQNSNTKQARNSRSSSSSSNSRSKRVVELGSTDDEAAKEEEEEVEDRESDNDSDATY